MSGLTLYIKAEESEESIHENHPLFWAINKFFELESDHPEMCWKAILEIIHREHSKKVFSVLDAGPLENLIENHGHKYINQIEMEARINSLFRHLLCGAWESSTPEIWNRILKARNNKFS